MQKGRTPNTMNQENFSGLYLTKPKTQVNIYEQVEYIQAHWNERFTVVKMHNTISHELMKLLLFFPLRHGVYSLSYTKF